MFFKGLEVSQEVCGQAHGCGAMPHPGVGALGYRLHVWPRPPSAQCRETCVTAVAAYFGVTDLGMNSAAPNAQPVSCVALSRMRQVQTSLRLH
jgi:hypothetical protein